MDGWSRWYAARCGAGSREVAHPELLDGRLRQTWRMISALVLTGAPGSGKSSVLEALSTLLEIEGVEHGAIESEELGRGFPATPAGRLGEQLAAALAIQREAGRRLFLIAATAETDDWLAQVVAAAAADRVLVIALKAPAEVLVERLEGREPGRWPGKAGLVAHARELAEVAPALAGIGVAIETSEREAEAVAVEVRGLMIERLPRW